MFPIQSPLALAVSILSINIAVTDTQYTATNGVDVQTQTGTRTITGAVDATNSKQMQHIFGGSVSDGDIMIITASPLYIDDVYTTSRGKQSFITYGGLSYRVANNSDWTPQAGLQVYLAKRHVKQAVV